MMGRLTKKAQSDETERWLSEVPKSLANSDGKDESEIFEGLIGSPTVYNPDKDPWKGEFYRRSFMKLPLETLPFKVRLPNRQEVKSLLTDIGNSCESNCP